MAGNDDMGQGAGDEKTEKPLRLTRRETIAASFTALAGLGVGGAAVAAHLRERGDAALMAAVAPELRPMLTAMTAMSAAQPAWSRANLPALRGGMARIVGKAPLPPGTERRVIVGPGDARLAVYVVNAAPGQSRPGILHVHGGGFILGSASDGLAGLHATARALDCTIVTVDYRLAPETDWRGSTADTYAALRWLHAEAGALGVDRARIAVMGESAGGGHAALLAQRAHDRGEVPVCFQCLTYPMLDDRTGSTVAKPWPMGAAIWTAEANRFGWSAFLGRAPGGKGVPIEAVPARRTTLAGLPPAWIGVGSIDLFVDEDIAYARRLVDSGVPTELVVVPGAFHGFDFAADVPLVRRFAASRLAALARAFGKDAPAQ